MTTPQPSLFFTSDADLAAFLRCRGQRYLRLQLNDSNPSVVDFIFPENEDVFQCLREWATEGESCLVDARLYGRYRHDTIRAARRFVLRAQG